jgi:hypothetical protein
MKNENLYHGFSYGNSFWGWSSVLDTISSNPLNPSIAYKSFNFYQIDYLWMEEAGSKYNIFHKRDPKHIWLGVNDPEADKGFSISGYPNPFSEKLTIKIATNGINARPEVRIYNFNSQLINILEPNTANPTEYEYIWSGLNSGGVTVEAGIYIITCSIGNKRTARKIVFNGR